MVTETTTTRHETITRELGGWHVPGSNRTHDRGRLFLILEIQDHDTVSPHMTITHEPAPATIRELTYAIDARSSLDLEVHTRGQNAIEFLQSATCTLTPGIKRAELFALIQRLDRWHLNGLKALCVHAADKGQTHICPGLRYGCECCGNTGPLTIEGSGMVGVVTAAGPAGYCEHNVLSRDLGCGYKQGSAWLSEPLPADEEASILAAARSF